MMKIATKYLRIFNPQFRFTHPVLKVFLTFLNIDFERITLAPHRFGYACFYSRISKILLL